MSSPRDGGKYVGRVARITGSADRIVQHVTFHFRDHFRDGDSESLGRTRGINEYSFDLDPDEYVMRVEQWCRSGYPGAQLSIEFHTNKGRVLRIAGDDAKGTVCHAAPGTEIVGIRIGRNTSKLQGVVTEPRFPAEVCASPSAVRTILYISPRPISSQRKLLADLCAAGDTKQVCQLLESNKNISINLPGLRGTTYLGWAAYNGHTDTVNALLDQKAEINQGNASGQTPLYLAACKNRARVAELLLERKANPTIPSQSGFTPVVVATDRGHCDAVKVFIRHMSKAAINRPVTWTDATLLIIAARSNRVNIVRELIRAGANTRARDSSGATAFTLAYKSRWFSLAAMIEDAPHAQRLLPKQGKAHAALIRDLVSTRLLPYDMLQLIVDAALY